MPMKLAVAYIMVTLLLHMIGPWIYPNESLGAVFLYIGLVTALFCLGYNSFARHFRGALWKDRELSVSNFHTFSRVAKVGLAIQCFFVILLAASDFMQGNMSIRDILNPGQIYMSALDAGREGGIVSLTTQLRTLLSPLIYFSNVFLLLNYVKLVDRWKLLLISTLILQTTYDVLSKGAQKGVFDLLIMVTSLGILSSYSNPRIYRRLKRFVGFFLLTAISLFFIFQLSRLSAFNALDYSGVDQMQLDRNGIFFSVFGDSLGLGIALFISYLSQGYYGLSLALQLPFEWTGGIGNSFALMSYAEQYLGTVGIAERTYPFRMEYVFGWPARMYWHTFFPWVASDLTFVGAALLMYPIGRLYAKSLVESLVFDSPFAASIFYFLSILLLYLPANNQLMQTREMMIGFTVLITLWLAFGRFYRQSYRKSYAANTSSSEIVVPQGTTSSASD